METDRQTMLVEIRRGATNWEVRVYRLWTKLPLERTTAVEFVERYVRMPFEQPPPPYRVVVVKREDAVY